MISWIYSRQGRRWLMFNAVGVMGTVVQLLFLAGLTGWMRLHYALGSLISVEAAILHNFLWHEHWTWIDRAGRAKYESLRRLLRFHLANGAVSIAGNTALMFLFVRALGWHFMIANVSGIAICSILNFVVADRLIFAGGELVPKIQAQFAEHLDYGTGLKTGRD